MNKKCEEYKVDRNYSLLLNSLALQWKTGSNALMKWRAVVIMMHFNQVLVSRAV